MPPAKAAYLFVVDGFADWEPAHAVAELRRTGGYRIEVAGLTAAPVRSMGGLTVTPSKPLSELNPTDVAVWIVPGGDRWERTPLEPELESTLKSLDAAGVPIAAICGATVAIARAGLLRGRRHTSNGLDYLRAHVPGYSDAKTYVDTLAVRDQKLITASGLADVEFAYQIFDELDVMSPQDRTSWMQIFRSAKLPGA